MTTAIRRKKAPSAPPTPPAPPRPRAERLAEVVECIRYEGWRAGKLAAEAQARLLDDLDRHGVSRFSAGTFEDAAERAGNCQALLGLFQTEANVAELVEARRAFLLAPSLGQPDPLRDYSAAQRDALAGVVVAPPAEREARTLRLACAWWMEETTSAALRHLECGTSRYGSCRDAVETILALGPVRVLSDVRGYERWLREALAAPERS